MPAPQPPKKKDSSVGKWSKNVAFWILLLLVPVALLQIVGARNEQAPKISYAPQYIGELERDNVKSVVIQSGKYVQGQFRTPVSVGGREVRRFTTNFPAENSEKEIDALRARGVQIEAQDARTPISSSRWACASTTA